MTSWHYNDTLRCLHCVPDWPNLWPRDVRQISPFHTAQEPYRPAIVMRRAYRLINTMFLQTSASTRFAVAMCQFSSQARNGWENDRQGKNMETNVKWNDNLMQRTWKLTKLWRNSLDDLCTVTYSQQTEIWLTLDFHRHFESCMCLNRR